MNLYIRVFLVLIKALLGARISGVLDPSIVRFRVLPNDLDFNMHMNNGRYLTIMDLGRFDLILRNGLMSLMLKQKSVPILGAAKIRYRLPLLPFQKYDLVTRVLCWDEKWVFMEQRFVIVDGTKTGAVAAIAILKGSFFDKNKKALVPTSDLMKSLGWIEASPAQPVHIQKWQEAEEVLRDITKDQA